MSPGRTIPQPFRAVVAQVASASAGLLFSTACHLALLLAVGGVWQAFLYGVRSVSFAGTECTLIHQACSWYQKRRDKTVALPLRGTWRGWRPGLRGTT